jgi:hypothetical protein
LPLLIQSMSTKNAGGDFNIMNLVSESCLLIPSPFPTESTFFSCLWHNSGRSELRRNAIHSRKLPLQDCTLLAAMALNELRFDVGS